MVKVITTSGYLVPRRELELVANKLLVSHGFENELVNLVFVGARKMRAVSRQYKQEDVALPVLSFSYLGESGNQSFISPPTVDSQTLIGEVLICYPQAVLLAAERNKPVDYIMKELVRHGVENIVKN